MYEDPHCGLTGALVQSRRETQSRTRYSRRSLRLLGMALLLCAGSTTGCIAVYQPMSGLHRPIAVDPTYANFTDLDLTLHCVPGDHLDRGETRSLCRKLGRLFENQGAEVHTLVGRSPLVDPDDEPDAAATDALAEKVRPKTALHVSLRSRVVHQESISIFGWDIVTDYTFAQDVTIRDEHGFLLAKDTLTGRVMMRLGAFEEAKDEFTRDYYGQISQLAFNAKMRRQVLRESQAKAGTN